MWRPPEVFWGIVPKWPAIRIGSHLRSSQSFHRYLGGEPAALYLRVLNSGFPNKTCPCGHPVIRKHVMWSLSTLCSDFSGFSLMAFSAQNSGNLGLTVWCRSISWAISYWGCACCGRWCSCWICTWSVGDFVILGVSCGFIWCCCGLISLSGGGGFLCGWGVCSKREIIA